MILVLPGLDGTAELRRPFVDTVERDEAIEVVALPDNPDDDYGSLCQHVGNLLSDDANYHLVAESFSGPLGILVASQYPDRVSELTLVGSFCQSPLPPGLSLLPWSILLRLQMPMFVARNFFAGGDREVAQQLRVAVQATSPRTLSRRLACVSRVDVRPQLRSLDCRVRYVRGNQDRVVSARSLRQIKKCRPSIEVCQLPGPHLILETQPSAVWQAIRGNREIR